MPPKKWLLDQIFGEGDVGMVYGPSGSGKTFFVIEMIITLCIAKLLANRFAVERRLNVAYCAGEGVSGLPARFKAAATYHGVVKMPNFTFYKTMPPIQQTHDIEMHGNWYRKELESPSNACRLYTSPNLKKSSLRKI